MGLLCRQCRPSSDAPPLVASYQGLHCLLKKIYMESAVKMIKHPPETLKTMNGLIQMIRMDKSTGLKRVNIFVSSAGLCDTVKYLNLV